jgi:hypothetical protein
MGKLIDITSQLKQSSESHNPELINSDLSDVLDFQKRRTEMLESDRRKVKRTILTEFVGSCVLIPQQGLKKVAIYDISESGISFDIEDGLELPTGEDFAMRVYLNKQTYFPFIMNITNSRFIENEGVYRHGASFVKGTINDLALFHFVKFIESVSASLRKDGGDILVSNLGR